MRAHLSALAAAVLAVAASSSPVAAAIVTTTYQGTVSFGIDDTGVFGDPGTLLTGDTFTAVFTENDSIPRYGLITADESFIYGGTEYGFATSPVSAVLTIDGKSLAIAGEYAGGLYQCNCSSNGLYDDAEDNSFNGSSGTITTLNLSLMSSVHQIVTTGDYHVPFHYTVQPGDYDSSSSFLIEGLSNSGPPTTPVLANFSITSVETTSGVPEPAMWAMMLFGFGALGTLMRARRALLHLSIG